MPKPSGSAQETVEAWLREESDGLRRLVRGLVRDPGAADDVLQETWIAALRSKPRRPASWLRVVLRRLAFRHARGNRRILRREAAAARPEATPSASEVAESLELRRRVIQAVAALPEPYRSAIVLRYFHDCSPAEVAESQRVPLATAKTRLHRALARLRKELADDPRGGPRPQRASLALLDLSQPGCRSRLASALGAGGGALAMKKAWVAVLLALVLGAGGWAAGPGGSPPSGPRAHRDADGDVVGASPLLRGRPPNLAAEESMGDSWVLTDGDIVPEATFAGRVVDENGTGVAGASVSLHWYSNGPRYGVAHGDDLLYRRERDRRDAPTVRTEDDGYFRLDRPYRSISFVRADADGFMPGVAYGMSGQFLLIRLARTESLALRVVTDDGAPVRNADVRLVTRWDFGGSPAAFARQVLAQATTDVAGRARLPVAPKGRCGLEVCPSDPALGIVQLRSVQGGPGDIEIRVPTVKTHSRRVVDADTGLPLAEAYADVLHRFSDFRTHSTDLLRRRIRADREGRLDIPVQDGTEVLVSAPGYEVDWRWATNPIALARAMRIEGTVRCAEGHLVKDAGLFLVMPGGGPYDTAYIGASPVAAFTDHEGRFSLDVRHGWSRSGGQGPDRGLCALIAAHPDHLGVAVEPGIAVTPGASVRLDLRLAAPASVDVCVEDPDGRPLDGVDVTARRLLPWPATWPAARARHGVEATRLVRCDRACTDTQGKARLDGLPPGPHEVQAGSAVARIDLTAGPTAQVRLVLAGGRAITGHVIDAAGVAVSGHDVRLGGPTAGGTQTDEAGRFRFDDLAGGDYLIYLAARTLGRHQLSTLARPGDDVTLRIPAGLARLRLHIEGIAAGHAEFQLLTSTGGHLSNPDAATRHRTHFITVPSSPYQTDEFTPGPGYLVIRVPNMGTRVMSFDAGELMTTEVWARFALPGSVSGQVLGSARLEDATVLLLPVVTGPDGSARRWADNVAQESTPVGAERSFHMLHVQPGPYEVLLLRRDGRTSVRGSPVRVQVRSGEVTEVVLNP